MDEDDNIIVHDSLQKMSIHLLWFIIRSDTYRFHLFQMFVSVVRMNHFVLHGDIIAAEELDYLSSGMDKVRDIVNDSFDCDLRTFQSFQRTESRFGCRVDLDSGSVRDAIA